MTLKSGIDKYKDSNVRFIIVSQRTPHAINLHSLPLSYSLTPNIRIMINLKQSVSAKLERAFDFNATPVMPTVTKMVQ